MNKTIFYQLFEHESSTYTYIVADPVSKEAAIIDAVLETVERDLKLIEELGLKLKYVLDTHVHADHVTGAGEIRKRTGAKTALSELAKVACVDIPMKNGQELFLGDKKIKAITTPGHTDSCISFLFDGRIFTGDALLIRGCGRTDFQQGSADRLFESVREKLFALPDETQVYPAHDYKGQTSSNIELEKKFNPRLGISKSREDFIKTMSELKLAHPKKIHEALPANLACGNIKSSRTIVPTLNDGVPEVEAQKVFENISKLKLIDVRNPDEFDGELGHIAGAKLVTLGPELTHFLAGEDRSQEIVFICRSGGRSGRATNESLKLGFKFSANLIGGMIKWNELQLPVERDL